MAACVCALTNPGRMSPPPASIVRLARNRRSTFFLGPTAAIAPSRIATAPSGKIVSFGIDGEHGAAGDEKVGALGRDHGQARSCPRIAPPGNFRLCSLT